jgi:hypothetical protein
MRLTPAQAAKLAVLSRGESLPKSDIPKRLLLPLRDAHAVRLEKSGSSYVVRGIPGRFDCVVAQIWGIHDLDALATANPENRNRAMLADVAGNSKALPTSPMNGVLIRCLNNCFLGDVSLGPTPSGSSLLVTMAALSKLRVETEYLISIEGVECFWKFEHALTHFPQLNGKSYTLVLRWHWNAAWRDWMRTWKGHFFHFPDYDPAGLGVFVNEILPYRPDARLLIPRNLESTLGERGRSDLYLKQEHLMPVASNHVEVVHLCKILRQYRKGLEHEHLL